MSGNTNPGDSTMLLMALWMIVAVALFFMRPDSARRVSLLSFLVIVQNGLSCWDLGIIGLLVMVLPFW